MANDRRSKPWTLGEKATAVAVLLVVAFGIAYWQFTLSMDADPVVYIPNPTMPSPNAFDYFVAAGQGGVGGPPMWGYPQPSSGQANGKGGNRASTQVARYAEPDYHDPAVQAAAAVLLKRDQPAIALLRQGMPYVYMNPPVRSFSALFPYLPSFRSMARVLAFQAEIDFARHDSRDAIQSSLDAVELGEKIPRGGILHLLDGIACEFIGRKPLWQNLGALGAGDCRSAIRRMETIEIEHVPLADTLQGEKWETQASLMETFRHSDWKQELIDMSGWVPDKPGDSIGFHLTSKRRLMADYTAYMDARMAAARQPYGAQPADTTTDPFVDMIAPYSDGIRFKDAYTEAENQLLLAALAVRLYRLNHDSYPDSLEKLVPSYLNAVPVDPFSANNPLRYRRTGTGYVLYSVGPDMKDDGGTPICDRREGGSARYVAGMNSQGDIVAGVNGW